MEQFIIEPNDYLKQSITAFYHADYEGGGKWKQSGTIENMICTLKNDITHYPPNVLQNAMQQLEKILLQDLQDLSEILWGQKLSNVIICVIPRAKSEKSYQPDQRLFRCTVLKIVQQLNGFMNGTNFIIRHTDTKTTHLKSGGGIGKSPYPGITKDTCTISEDVRGKDILLIDDLYTKTVNIDEDVIQALLDKGAKSVIFYAVGKTVHLEKK